MSQSALSSLGPYRFFYLEVQWVLWSIKASEMCLSTCTLPRGGLLCSNATAWAKVKPQPSKSDRPQSQKGCNKYPGTKHLPLSRDSQDQWIRSDLTYYVYIYIYTYVYIYICVCVCVCPDFYIHTVCVSVYACVQSYIYNINDRPTMLADVSILLGRWLKLSLKSKLNPHLLPIESLHPWVTHCSLLLSHEVWETHGWKQVGSHVQVKLLQVREDAVDPEIPDNTKGSRVILAHVTEASIITWFTCHDHLLTAWESCKSSVYIKYVYIYICVCVCVNICLYVYLSCFFILIFIYDLFIYWYWYWYITLLQPRLRLRLKDSR